MKRILAGVLIVTVAGCMPKGGTEYNAGVEKMNANQWADAKTQFEKATSINPDFCEAWYNLGAVKAHLAKVEAGAKKDKEAIALFRAAIEDKKKAKALMDQDKWVVYSKGAEQDRIKKECEDTLQKCETFIRNDAMVLLAISGIPDSAAPSK